VLPLISVLTVLHDGGLSWELLSSDFVPKEIFKEKEWLVSATPQN